MRLSRNVSCINEKSNVYKLLVRKLEGERTVTRSKCRRDYHIKFDDNERGYEVDSSAPCCLATVDSFEHRNRIRNQQNITRFLSSLATSSFS
jgi:hypothetical protein